MGFDFVYISCPLSMKIIICSGGHELYVYDQNNSIPFFFLQVRLLETHNGKCNTNNLLFKLTHK